MRRAAPRPLREALPGVIHGVAPASVLAHVQERWTTAMGEAIAREADPVAEGDGIVTVTCRSAVWAQELELLSPELVRRLNDALDEAGAGRPVRQLRVVVDGRAASG